MISRLFFLIVLVTFSCKSYKENIMFTVEEPVKDSLESSGNLYTISPNDRLLIDIYTLKGEKLIDPDRQLMGDSEYREKKETEYIVQPDGIVDLPMIGEVNLSGKTLFEASAFLENEYSTFYADPYVLVRYQNKRVFVLGATGQQTDGQVIILEDDKLRVAEVLAMAGGLSRDSKAHNIRLLRGNDVMLIDFSTFEGYQQNNVVVEPGDIIYVEPIRRPFTETLRDNAALIGITTSLVSLVSLIVSLSN